MARRNIEDTRCTDITLSHAADAMFPPKPMYTFTGTCIVDFDAHKESIVT